MNADILPSIYSYSTLSEVNVSFKSVGNYQDRSWCFQQFIGQKTQLGYTFINKI